MNNEPTPPPPWNPETCIVRRGDWVCIADAASADPWSTASRRVRASAVTGYRLNGSMVLIATGSDATAVDVPIYLPVTGELTAAVLGLRVLQRLDALLDDPPEVVRPVVLSTKTERDMMLDDILALLVEAGVPTPEETYKADGGWSLALSDIRRALSTIHGLRADLRKLVSVLIRANDLCRSMHSVAERGGTATDWQNFCVQLNQALKEQHEMLRQCPPTVST